MTYSSSIFFFEIFRLQHLMQRCQRPALDGTILLGNWNSCSFPKLQRFVSSISDDSLLRFCPYHTFCLRDITTQKFFLDQDCTCNPSTKRWIGKDGGECPHANDLEGYYQWVPYFLLILVSLNQTLPKLHPKLTQKWPKGYPKVTQKFNPNWSKIDPKSTQKLTL